MKRSTRWLRGGHSSSLTDDVSKCCLPQLICAHRASCGFAYSSLLARGFTAISSARARARVLFPNSGRGLLWRLSSSALRGGLGMAGVDVLENPAFYTGRLNHAGANSTGRGVEGVRSDTSGKDANHNPASWSPNFGNHPGVIFGPSRAIV